MLQITGEQYEKNKFPDVFIEVTDPLGTVSGLKLEMPLLQKKEKEVMDSMRKSLLQIAKGKCGRPANLRVFWKIVNGTKMEYFKENIYS